LKVISTICNLYDADGLYVIDSAKHSPLIGFAYDGFPIYGAYAYKNTDGTGGIVRMKSSFSLRNITTRTTYSDGSNVTAGPDVNATYPLGYFREDYQYNTTTAADYLDEHNGRFCITPEYPKGIYCYFATVDSNWNSAYPYVVGPTFYGPKVVAKVTSITENVTTYSPTNAGVSDKEIKESDISVFPNPTNDLVAIQVNDIIRENMDVALYDITGKLIQKTILYQGSTIAYFDTQTIYNGNYIIKVSGNNSNIIKKITVLK